MKDYFSPFFKKKFFWASFQRHGGVSLYRLDWIQGSLAVKAHCFAHSHSNQISVSDLIVILHTGKGHGNCFVRGEIELSLTDNLFLFKNWKKFTFVYFLLWVIEVFVFSTAIFWHANSNLFLCAKNPSCVLSTLWNRVEGNMPFSMKILMTELKHDSSGHCSKQ